jgi:predicted esterase
MRAINIETPTHGRVLVEESVGESTATIVAFHGYAQSADDLMAELKQVPGGHDCTLASVQALNRFYTRGDSTIVANWMTRQDRDQAIADNIEYIDRAIEQIPTAEPLFVLGFSQGVAMAYRAVLLGRHRVAGIVAVGGDVPPDVKSISADRWPRVFIAAGDTDHWYTPDKVAADEAFLRAHGVKHELLRYAAGHVFTDEVRVRIASFITGTR